MIKFSIILFLWIATGFVNSYHLQNAGRRTHITQRTPTQLTLKSQSREVPLSETLDNVGGIPRRWFLWGGAAGLGWMNLALPSFSAFADPSPAAVEETIVVQGTVTLDGDATVPSTSTNAALYVTCRPDRPDNVPSAILSGTRGKPPPVLAAKFENPTFPFQFQLSSPQHLTIEGAASSTNTAAADNNNDTPILDPSKFWWKQEDLIVSARWDSDGVAATRSPEDLVGRGLFKLDGTNSLVEVPLTGRGAFGKFATGGSKK